MTHSLPIPSGTEHQSGPGPMGNYGNVEPSMTTVAASLGVPNNTVVSMATMTQPINQLASPGQSNRPAFSPSYRGRPRGRRPSGSRGGWSGGVGEKRTAQAAGLNNNIRRPAQHRGAYRGAWPNRSPSKTSPTGSNQSTVHGSNSQDSVDLVHDSDSMMVQTPQSLQGNPGGGGEVGGYHGNPSASRTPVNSTPSSLDSQTQTANLYGDGRDYSSPVALDHMPSPWQHHLSQHPHFSPAPPNASNQQDRSFKTEPEHGGEFPHTATRSEPVPVNEGERVRCKIIFQIC